MLIIKNIHLHKQHKLFKKILKMTIKQKIMKAAYPIVMWLSSFKNKEAKIKINSLMVLPAEPIYNFSTDLIDDNKFSFSDLKGKKILLVNTASDCGFTNQYEDLEKLYKKYNGRLVILGFPSNDFQQQESGSNQAIANFCKLFFGVSFPLMKKTGVIKNNEQNDVFNWLTNAGKNGWNNKAPSWNFCKYLVNEEGVLTHYFDSAVSPMSAEVFQAIG